MRVCQLLEIADVFSSICNPQKNGQAERYNQTLTAIKRWYDNDHQKDRDAHGSKLTNGYNSQIDRLTNTRPFDPMLSRRNLDFKVGSIVWTKNITSASKQQDEFLTQL